MYDNRYYLESKKNNKCHQCGEPSIGTCEKCKERKNLLSRNRRQERKKTQICVDCGQPKDGAKGTQCIGCAEKANQRSLMRLKKSVNDNRCYQCNKTKNREGIICNECFSIASERRKNSYKKLREENICFACKKEKTDGSLLCRVCSLERENFLVEHCSDCGKIKEDFSSDRCARCKSQRMNNYFFYKNLVYDHYGAFCACCGESNLCMLTVDHKNNDGSEHRKKLGSASIYRDIVNNNYPEYYQILCYNCNCGRDKNPFSEGICPHKMSKSMDWEQLTKKGQKQRWKLKGKVISHYGGKCVCCSEENILFLTLDHINNDGAKHRKEIGREALWRWAFDNDYPGFLQVMCYSCNTGSYRNGWICPHSQDNEIQIRSKL